MPITICTVYICYFTQLCKQDLCFRRNPKSTGQLDSFCCCWGQAMWQSWIELQAKGLREYICTSPLRTGITFLALLDLGDNGPDPPIVTSGDYPSTNGAPVESWVPMTWWSFSDASGGSASAPSAWWCRWLFSPSSVQRRLFKERMLWFSCLWVFLKLG